ncbi:sigma 54-interacting transcriptional regulator [Anaerovorax odorimutans]|uniref:Sigma 54-interacting transcriptional regulator n=1 Tax=Anaerovorax odorimutans TaxID=109327 RepID=A0ABT1RQL1_9FIRM|nr:sigma 54-interacting transcriptional regulator [Anaerovorax odorimutans]MCQ4637485.1 sigma 54-interacting transcriptional regulator [Anaerovorax odorimutans]
MGKNKHQDFQLTPEECKRILDHIGGLVVIDQEGKIRYLSEDMRERISSISGERLPEQVVGKDIREIHPTSKLIDLLESGSNDDLAVYLTMGFINIARVRPLYEDGKLAGAMDFDLFGNAEDLKKLFDKLVKLTEEGILDFSDSIDLITTKDKRLKNIKYSISDILGESPGILDLKKQLFRMSDSESMVLIEAETGCGKELVAHSIHNLSKRRKNPLIEINCAAIPENLFESELFGYEEGSFTGAQHGGKAGKLELAEKGTLFLDEIDKLPYHIQPKLLRVLQEREFARIGGKVKPMDVRIIAASNKNLAALVREDKFREDLYYRLNVIRLTIPPLRERKEDIGLFVEQGIREMNDRLNKNVEGVSPQVMKVFNEYGWPGNVRELKNLIERAMNLCGGKRIELSDLGDFLSEALYPELDGDFLSESNPLQRARDLAEQKVILKALDLCGGNKQKTAELLKISRATLYNKLDGISKSV